MDERQFYVEKQETKTIPLTCPACRKCRKRFELTGQSVVLVTSNVAAPGSADFDPENFGNR